MYAAPFAFISVIAVKSSVKSQSTSTANIIEIGATVYPLKRNGQVVAFELIILVWICTLRVNSLLRITKQNGKKNK